MVFTEFSFFFFSLLASFYFSIDNHTLGVIEGDGMLFQPKFQVARAPINVGQRVSFITTANQNIDNYWMRYEFQENCFRNKSKPFEPSANAIVRYEGAPEKYPTT